MIDKNERVKSIIESKSIKLHRFLPSGRQVWTVIGKEGDQLVDISQPYCSCRDFHFKFLTYSILECYHLVAIRKVLLTNFYDIIDFQDAEFLPFMQGLIKDLPH